MLYLALWLIMQNIIHFLIEIRIRISKMQHFKNFIVLIKALNTLFSQSVIKFQLILQIGK